MGHREPSSIAEVLRQIQDRRLILPAIQREYVWKPSQVIQLFDSLMRGYPIGSFLSWRVQPETIRQFKFYGFMQEFSDFDNRHNPSVDIPSDREVVAVLDGQQRLTSLNIGLRGTYAYKKHRGWARNASSFPPRRLYLNLAGHAPENELGIQYHFQFLTESEFEASSDEPGRKWLRVSDVYECNELSELMMLLAQIGEGNNFDSIDLASKLWKSVHNVQSLQFYEEEDQDIERVLDIFVRVNSGGTILSYSDLLLSIATAQWQGDARAAVNDLVDSLNQTGNGFSFSRDTILKSGLVLADVGDIGFKVRNFTADNMKKLEEGWDAMSHSLEIAVGLLSDFGLSGGSLTADSVLIPLAYYVHHRGLSHSYRESPSTRTDRDTLRSWVLRSLIVRGVWGSGLDTLLRDLRQVIKTNGSERFPIEPLERAMSQRGKSLEVTDALIDDLLNLEYGKARTYAVLATLFPHIDTRNQFHIDHVFPSALLDKKRLRLLGSDDPSLKLDEEEIDTILISKNRLPNLQLLPGPENIGKSARLPEAWLSAAYSTPSERSAFLERNSLPHTLPNGVGEFPEFFRQRREKLEQLIRNRLTNSFDADSPKDLTYNPASDLGEIVAEGDDPA